MMSAPQPGAFGDLLGSVHNNGSLFHIFGSTSIRSHGQYLALAGHL
jgi:hypothetical protein